MGRPISFDKDQALERALEVFIEHGYEGTTLARLSKAMGIWRQSLYFSFGSKEELFLQSLDKYTQKTLSAVYAAIEEPTSFQVINELLKRYVFAITDPKHPNGCLIVQGLLASGNEHIRGELLKRESFDRKVLGERLERGRSEGDLSADASPDDIALYIATFAQGLAIAAAKGEQQATLLTLVEMALKGLQPFFRKSPMH